MEFESMNSMQNENTVQKPLVLYEVLPKADLVVCCSDTFDYVGSTLDSNITLIEDIMAFLHNCVSGDNTQLIQLRENIKVFLKRSSSNSEAMWITIRVSRGHKQFPQHVIPRWHRDGPMYKVDPCSGLQSTKYVVTLLGADTRLLDDSSDIISDDILMDKSLSRDDIASQLKCYPRVELKEHQIFQFICGEGCPVHSEPLIDSDRIFMSIVPGTESQIREFCGHWSRKWTFGERVIR